MPEAINNKAKNKAKNKQVRRFTFDSRIDYAVILPVLLLIVIGLYALWVAVSHDYPNQAMTFVLQQGSWVIIGLVIAFLVMHLDAKWLWQLTPAFYFIGLALLVLPLFLFDPNLVASTGAKNWVSIGGHTLFQPSEFMKITYILMLSRWIVSFQDKLETRELKDDFRLIGRLFLATLPVAVLSVFQHDFGTFLVFVVILAGLILVSGVSWKIILPAVLAVVLIIVAVVLLVMNPTGQKFLGEVFSQYQVNRFVAWLHPFEYTETFSAQQAAALTSVGIGGLFGKGLGMANVHVPVRESDMIFTVIGEDFGFIGGVVVIVLYFILIARMIRATFQSNNPFYTYISTGFIMLLLFHVFENIGAAIGVVPLTGIPLPFISQGGSALMADLIGVGLVLSMKYNQLPDWFNARDQARRNLEIKKNKRRRAKASQMASKS
ncbi:FtsW/RodA/SpoVE family cell cycle protein [Lactococcus termiticola]|uniref:Rod shape-determining protein RodA n=1 Tax=Lactococcus termiticola TaxID=2169526 RepID=A0A2R5HFK1_9LACT|nr:FtsW/RodA/SpoVE family cell cycle protein [Lactococcus termiticola]GBG96616.1 rod shape-determining protein RodA [Lactococcus termiticola]